MSVHNAVRLRPAWTDGRREMYHQNQRFRCDGRSLRAERNSDPLADTYGRHQPTWSATARHERSCDVGDVSLRPGGIGWIWHTRGQPVPCACCPDDVRRMLLPSQAILRRRC